MTSIPVQIYYECPLPYVQWDDSSTKIKAIYHTSPKVTEESLVDMDLLKLTRIINQLSDDTNYLRPLLENAPIPPEAADRQLLKEELDVDTELLTLARKRYHKLQGRCTIL